MHFTALKDQYRITKCGYYEKKVQIIKFISRSVLCFYIICPNQMHITTLLFCFKHYTTGSDCSNSWGSLCQSCIGPLESCLQIATRDVSVQSSHPSWKQYDRFDVLLCEWWITVDSFVRVNVAEESVTPSSPPLLRWRQHVFPKRWQPSIKLQCVIIQRTIIFIMMWLNKNYFFS
jgi:hypothetical protein